MKYFSPILSLETEHLEYKVRFTTGLKLQPFYNRSVSIRGRAEQFRYRMSSSYGDNHGLHLTEYSKYINFLKCQQIRFNLSQIDSV